MRKAHSSMIRTLVGIFLLYQMLNSVWKSHNFPKQLNCHRLLSATRGNHAPVTATWKTCPWPGNHLSLPGRGTQHLATTYHLWEVPL